MAEIVSAVYASADTLPNVRDELIPTGIPQEDIRVDHERSRCR
jgi:hypothetical protein